MPLDIGVIFASLVAIYACAKSLHYNQYRMEGIEIFILSAILVVATGTGTGCIADLFIH